MHSDYAGSENSSCYTFEELRRYVGVLTSNRLMRANREVSCKVLGQDGAFPKKDGVAHRPHLILARRKRLMQTVQTCQKFLKKKSPPRK